MDTAISATPAASTIWGTGLTETTEDRIAIRGYDIAELVGAVPFPAVVHLLYTGELPNPSTARLVDAVMVASIDHGAGAPSALAARTVISGGASLQAGAAAGLLALGEHHGTAVEAAMQVLAAVVESATDGQGSLAQAADQQVAALRDACRRVPGFGHRQHRRRDPRLDRLFTLAREEGLAGSHLAAAEAVETALTQAIGRPVPINIDGAMAALLGEVGFPSALGNALFMASRVAGILAHAHEERHTMPPMRRIDPTNHEYRGPAPRPLPTDHPVLCTGSPPLEGDPVHRTGGGGEGMPR